MWWRNTAKTGWYRSSPLVRWRREMLSRDVGRALDLPYAQVDMVAKMIPTELGITIDKALK